MPRLGVEGGLEEKTLRSEEGKEKHGGEERRKREKGGRGGEAMA